MIDHIGLVPTEASKNSNSSFILGNVSRALHSIARDYAPGYVLAQLNRESAKRKDPTPTFADLYGSDRIMQDTDNLLLLHRPEMYIESGGEEPENKLVTEDVGDEEEVAVVIIEKQRDGAAGKRIPMNYIPKYALWADLQTEEYDDEPV
jgi:replicative DNA helicase